MAYSIESFKSERVTLLLASCIRTAVRIKFGKDLPFPDALDLARVYGVRAALRTLHDKLEVYQSWPDPKDKFGIAVTEVKIIGGDETHPEDITKVREELRKKLDAEREQAANQRVFLENLRNVESEFTKWSSDYLAFVREVYELQRRTRAEVQRLSLSQEAKARAFKEIEAIILRAVSVA